MTVATAPVQPVQPVRNAADPWSLIGIPFRWNGVSPEHGFDCLTFMAWYHDQIGRHFPMPAETTRGHITIDVLRDYLTCWQPSPPIPGAVVWMVAPDGQQHIGAMIDQRHVIHCARGTGVAVQRLALFRMAGSVLGIYVPKGSGGGRVVIQLVTIDNPFDLSTMQDRRDVDPPPGATVGELLDQELGADRAARMAVIRRGVGVGRDEPILDHDALVAVELPAGAEIGAAIVTAIVTAAISAGISFLVSLLIGPPDTSDGSDDEASKTFTFQGIRNTIGEGNPRGICFGEHPVAGQVLQKYRACADGTSTTEFLYVLLGLGRGPFTEIGGYSNDIDGLVPGGQFIETCEDDEDLRDDPDWGLASAFGTSGDIAKSSNQLLITGASHAGVTADNFIGWSGGNARASFDFVSTTGTVHGGVAVNLRDDTEYHALLVTSSTNVRLIKRESSTDTTIANFTAAAGETWTLARFDDELRVYQDGVLQATHDADTDLTDGTVGVVKKSGTGTLTLDNITFEGEQKLPESLLINDVNGNAVRHVRGNIRIGRDFQSKLGADFSRVIRRYEQNITTDSAWIIYDCRDAIQGFMINLDFPGGLFDGSSGLSSSDAQIAVEYRPDASTAWSAISGSPFTITEALTTPFTRTIFHEPATPLSGSAQQIRIRRVDRELGLGDPAISDKCVFGEVNEILRADRQRYNGDGLLALRIKATDQFSDPNPTVRIGSKGLAAPTWDGTSGTSGIESQQPYLTCQWSQNPAWIALWMILDAADGLGNMFSTSNIDFDAFKAWADYCDDTLEYYRANDEPLFETINTEAATAAATAIVVDDSDDADEFAAGDFVVIEFEPVNRILVKTDLGGGRFEFELENPVEETYPESWRFKKVDLDDLISESRHRFDGVFDASISAWDALLRVCRMGRGMPVMRADRISVRIEHTGSPVQHINESNVIKGSMSIDYIGSGEATDVVTARFFDRDQSYEGSFATAGGLPVSSAARGAVERSIDLFGITRRSHAEREANYDLRAKRLVRKRLKFQMAADGLAAEQGDIISFGATLTDWSLWTGRAWGTKDGLKLSHPITLAPATTYQAYIRTPGNRAGEVVTITAGDGTYDTGDVIATDGTSDAIAAAVVTIGEQDDLVTLWRIVRLSINQELTIDVEAVQYVTEIYDVIGWTGSEPGTPEPPECGTSESPGVIGPGIYTLQFDEPCPQPVDCPDVGGGFSDCCDDREIIIAVTGVGASCVTLDPSSTWNNVMFTVVKGCDGAQFCITLTTGGFWKQRPASCGGCDGACLAEAIHSECDETDECCFIIDDDLGSV